MNNYVTYHLHSDLSNPTVSTGADSTTKYKQYLDRAVELGMSSIAFSEHGNIFNWIQKKQETEKRGLKYIHANEIYLTEHIDKEKGLIRDNYHFMLIARNLNGVKELNALTSKSFNREDGHFYYNPRLSFNELFSTSDNLLMTSACLASPLWRAIKRENKQVLQSLQDFFVKNKHRMFLEIQYHSHPEQVEFNKWLYQFSKEAQIPLIAGTDTHSLNKEHQAARKILMMAKGATYGDEDLFDLTFKSYNELVQMFKSQNAIPEDAYLEAIYNTNVMANMVEQFSLDSEPKYPKLYDNPIKVFKEKIELGIKNRKVNCLSKEDRTKYIERIKDEFAVYKKTDTIDYMLLQTNIIDWCKNKGIYQGYGRGSVNGSLIAYLLGITEMDSIKHNLNFFRFLNPERVTLADIDIDFPPSRRQEVIDYVANLRKIHFSEIITYNTIALKGAIREVGRALKIPLFEVDEIAKSVYKDDEKGDVVNQKYRDKYAELFSYVDLLNGVVISIGSHPSGFLVSPITLDDNIGLCYTKESKYAVSQINMKELESLNFVKLDILGLANIEIINDTCDLAGIERLTPDNINENDIDVWSALTESTLGIFQWESETAYNYIKKLLDKETIKKIKVKLPNYKLIDLLSVGNGAIRPSGASYRDNLAQGIFKNNGHEGLNELLHDTLGYLVYQEQIMRFLTQFCNFSDAQSDSVRRGLAKKAGTEQYLGDIQNGFFNFMKSKYEIDQDRASELLSSFLDVIRDASDYGFSVNHSQPYSYTGYICGYLRYHYPLEFLTVMLNINNDDKEKTAKIFEYAKQKGIQVKSIRFGRSTANYSVNREEKAIYKGVGSISFLSSTVAEELFKISTENYNSFADLLFHMHLNTSANFKQVRILTSLGYFDMFGKNKKLLAIVDEYENRLKNKNLKEETKQKRLQLIREFELSEEDISLGIKEQIKAEIDYYGYEVTTFEKSPLSVFIVTEINTKYTPKIRLYNLKSGEVLVLKCNKNDIKKNLFGELSIIQVKMILERAKRRKVNNEWIDTGEKEKYLSDWTVLK
ncbi:DNA polymerase III subunit alpha [Brevibacillus laterosporus]|uniref:DNA polymerase III subunit alpha n=1 Tax=Brevibacillus laterosporus TaxID=1465 RepID=UPI000CE2F020|nr:DNA polymerase III subunit alpha [Brevibacillus laterosporus]PPA84968.1 DNA polymerase III subunit alpha [Brevibacillus laterosporus]